MVFDGFLWPITGWQDVGAIVSSAFSILLLVSAYLGFRQVHSSVMATKIEKSIDIYMKNTDRFSALTSQRHALDMRVAAGDTTVRYGAYHDYFVSYWSLQVEQFQYFLAGLIPLNIYLIWMSYLNQKLNNSDRYTYFDDNGRTASIESLAVYELCCKGTSLVNNVEAIAFFEQLRQIKFDGFSAEASGPAIGEERRKRITALLVKTRRKSGRKFWIT